MKKPRSKEESLYICLVLHIEDILLQKYPGVYGFPTLPLIEDKRKFHHYWKLCDSVTPLGNSNTKNQAQCSSTLTRTLFKFLQLVQTLNHFAYKHLSISNQPLQTDQFA